MNKRGIFISFEGIDGSGKSFHVQALCHYLSEIERPYILLREPGGTEIGEAIRQILLSRDNVRMSSETELLLFLAARAQIVEERIRPALEDGIIVICDRFIDSTVAYQGYGRGLDPARIAQLNTGAIKECRPDLTLWLDVPMDVALGRLSKRGEKQDRLDLEDQQFMERTRQGYEILSLAEPERIKRIKADRSKDETQAEIRDYVRRYLS